MKKDKRATLQCRVNEDEEKAFQDFLDLMTTKHNYINKGHVMRSIINALMNEQGRKELEELLLKYK